MLSDIGGEGSGRLTSTRDGKKTKWTGIMFHPGGPYFSQGCATSPDPSFVIVDPKTHLGHANNKKWETYVKSVMPGMVDGRDPTFVYLPPVSVIKDTPKPKE